MPEEEKQASAELVLTVPDAAIVPAAIGPADPVGVYLATLRTPKSRATGTDSLRRALRFLDVDPDRFRTVPWHRLTVAHATALDARLARDCKPATQRVTRACVKGVWEACWRLGMLDGETLKRLVAAWPRIRAESAPVGRALSKEEIGALRRYCDGRKPFEGAYLWAMLACAVGAGLRRDEIARLGADALSDDGRHLHVIGKGQKERVHPIPPSVGASLESWLAQRARVELQTTTMFPWLYRGKLRDREASPWSIWRAIRDVGTGAKLAPFTPHDLRRTYATHWIRTKDLATARRLMRHKDPKTTMLYDRRGDEELDAIVGEIDDLLGS